MSQKRRANNNSQQTNKDSAQEAFDNLSPEERGKLVADLTRYIIFCGAQNKTLWKKDFSDVLGNYKKHVSCVLELVKKRLTEIFGYELIEMSSIPKNQVLDKKAHQGKYLLKNVVKIPKRLEYLAPEDTKLQQMGLLMVVVSLIYLTKKIDEDALYNYLRKLGLKQKQEHDVFNTWEKKITNDFTKMNYINRTKVSGRSTDDGNPVYEYTLGPRTTAEIGAEEIMSFVAAMSGEVLDEMTRKAIENEAEEEEQELVIDDQNN